MIKEDKGKEEQPASRFNFGASSVLGTAKTVVEAFGRPLGFILLVLGLFTNASWAFVAWQIASKSGVFKIAALGF